jgi:predicted RNase H-like HicB family nuclease
MLTDYIHAAMHQATYELLPDGEGFYGEIPALEGVWANASTLEVCHEELQKVLEGWVVVGLRFGHSIPVINGIDLNTPCTNEFALFADS